MKAVDMLRLAWLDMGMDIDYPVTREQAEAVLALVERKFSSYLKTFGTTADGKIDFETLVDVPASERPQLVENWDDAGNWAIVWESGAPSEWAYTGLEDVYVDQEIATTLRDEFQARSPEQTASSAGVQGMPKGVHAEPYYSFVLVLYPTA